MTHQGVFSSDTYAIAQYVTFTIPDVAVQYRFKISISPRRCPGAVRRSPLCRLASVESRLTEMVATSIQLVFPNNEISRVWALKLLRSSGWLVCARSWLIRTTHKQRQMKRIAACFTTTRAKFLPAAGTIKHLSLRLNSVLDAVRGNAPNRKLNRNTCGRLPNSNRIAV